VLALNCANVRPSPKPRWHLALIFTAAPICLVSACTTAASYGPGSGTVTGIIRPCTPHDEPGTSGHFGRIVTVKAKNQSGQTTATQQLARTNRLGVRYRLRVSAGPFTIDASSGGNSAGAVVTVTAHKIATVNFTGGGGCV
jgi:hypothetical protein